MSAPEPEQAATVTRGTVRCSALLGVSFDCEQIARIELSVDGCVLTLDSGVIWNVPRQDFERVSIMGYAESLDTFLRLADANLCHAAVELGQGKLRRVLLDFRDTSNLRNKEEVGSV